MGRGRVVTRDMHKDRKAEWYWSGSNGNGILLIMGFIYKFLVWIYT